MEAFRFYQDRKVTCWERIHFEVTAERITRKPLPLSSRGKVRTCFALRMMRKSSSQTERPCMTPPKTYP